MKHEKRKTPLFITDKNDALSFAENDIKDNWKVYKQRFLQLLIGLKIMQKKLQKTMKKIMSVSKWMLDLKLLIRKLEKLNLRGLHTFL